MSTFVANTVIGLSLGGIFALAALGIVLVYRVTGVLNFANGAMGMFSTFVAWDVFFHHSGENFWLALVAGVVFSIVLGLALQWAVFYWLAARTQLVKAVVTIGVLLALQAGASLIWGNTQYHLPIPVPGSDHVVQIRSEEHTSELQSRRDIVCRLLLEKKKKTNHIYSYDTKIKSPVRFYANRDSLSMYINRD